MFSIFMDSNADISFELFIELFILIAGIPILLVTNSANFVKFILLDDNSFTFVGCWYNLYICFVFEQFKIVLPT